MIHSFKTIRKEWALVSILIVSFVLRIWGLTYQSLWLDELHNMNEADPEITWGALFNYLKCCDQHPPLYFIVERISFTTFGHTEFVARIISVIAGTASVWAMWLLGKEILNRKLGIIAALLTGANYYNIFYSQEARVYIFAFLFAALSFTFFIRLVKSPSRKTALFHALFSLCLLYSHYYSLFVMVSQGVLALLFLWTENGPGKKRLFRNFFFSFIIIIIGYIPWLPFLFAMTEIKSFWISDIPADFIVTFFFDYFGNARLLKPLLIVLLLVHILHVSLTLRSSPLNKPKSNPLVLSFWILIPWVFITYLIPYIRSVLVVPMLFPRYTIVVVPAILLELAYGIVLLKYDLLKFLITGLFVIFSLVNIIFVRNHYTGVRKTQFREMTQFVVRENSINYPIVNQVTAWHQQYYFKKYKSAAQVLTGSKDKLIDSIINKRWTPEGLWVVGAHGEGKLDDTRMTALRNNYILSKQQNFYDAWAQLFVLKAQSDSYYKQYDSNKVIKFNAFAPNEGTVYPIDERIAIWGGAIHTNPVSLAKGIYDITISAMGTDVRGEYPHVNIYANGEKIASYYVSGVMNDKIFKFQNRRDRDVVLKIDFDNDLTIEGEGDRNLFLKYIILKKIGN